MKKLSEFKDEQGAIVVAKLLPPIFEIIQSAANAEARDGKTPIEFISLMLENSPKAMKNIFAILSEVEPEDYHTNAAEILANVVTLATDEDMMSLFGLRRQTQTSSGSASESFETGEQE